MTTAMAITAEGLGRGDDRLGARLMTKFVQQVAAQVPRPQSIAFYNAGVKLLLPESPVVDALKALEADGVELLACGTCLDHFDMRDRLAAGRVSDMREILSTLAAADKSMIV
jgi:selenium metabolism protein YedF